MPEEKMIVSGGFWVCTVLTLSGLQQAQRAMIQLKISTFPVTRTSSKQAVLFSILCPWSYLPLEVSVSLNGDAGNVFADDSVFLVSSSRKFFT